MKGLILAGGAGTRLYPVSKVVNKHLIPIGKSPMIYYPVRTLVDSGVTEIMVITGPQSIGSIAELLGSGREFGCNFYFRVQERPIGISDGIRLAREFTGDDRLMVMLGDNLVRETFADIVTQFERSAMGCQIFLKEMQDVEGLGVGCVENGVVTPIFHKGEQTRLGRGVFDTGRLRPEAISDTARVVGAFAARAKEEGADTVRVLATSAVREAGNSDQLAAAIAAGGLELEIIDGQTEAELVLRGVRSLPDLATGPLAIIDVGGGSTELLVADDAALRLQHSFALGTVRWLGSYSVSETPTAVERAKLAQALDDFLDEQVTPKLGGVPLPGTLVGAGGTPVFLSRIFKERDDLAADEIESLRLSLPEVQTLTNRLWQMPLAARGELPGLPANRADVILFGAAIYEAVMMRCGFHELRPTLRGVRYGALLS